MWGIKGRFIVIAERIDGHPRQCISTRETLAAWRVAMGNIKAPTSLRSVLRADLMRVVVALDELGSVRAAAEALSLTPSAVSKQLQRVEALLGKPLFARSRQGVVANAEGADLAALGKRFLELVDEVGARFDRETVHGHVRLGITDDVGLTRMPDILQVCAVRFPGLEVQLTVGYSSDLIQDMVQQKLDLALVSDGGAPVPSGATLLRSEPMVWAARRGLARPVHPVPLAVSTEGCQWRARALAMLAATGIGYKIACISPSTAGQIAAARIGLGVAPLPASVIAGERDVEPLANLPSLPSCAIALLSPRRVGKALLTLRSAIISAYGPRR